MIRAGASKPSSRQQILHFFSSLVRSLPISPTCCSGHIRLALTAHSSLMGIRLLNVQNDVHGIALLTRLEVKTYAFPVWIFTCRFGRTIVPLVPLDCWTSKTCIWSCNRVAI